MEEMPDWVLWGVVVAAFVVGYGVVSFVLRRVKELQNRPSLMDDLWRSEDSVSGSRGRTEVLSPTEVDPGEPEGQTISKPGTFHPRPIRHK